MVTSRGHRYYYGSKGGRLHMEEDEVNGWLNQEQDFHQQHHCLSVVKVNYLVIFWEQLVQHHRRQEVSVYSLAIDSLGSLASCGEEH